MGGHYVLDEYGDRNVNFSIIFTSTITGKVNKSSAPHHRHSLIVFMCKWLPLWQKDCRLNKELTQFPHNGNHHVENWCYSARVAQSESTEAPMFLPLSVFSTKPLWFLTHPETKLPSLTNHQPCSGVWVSCRMMCQKTQVGSEKGLDKKMSGCVCI